MKRILGLFLIGLLVAGNCYATITWTKTWSAADDGSTFGGADIGNIQNDISTQAATSSTGASTYAISFVDGDLSSGILTVTHNLSKQFVCYAIYDNNSKNILPDEATATSSNVLTVDLSSYGTITGTWQIRVTA